MCVCELLVHVLQCKISQACTSLPTLGSDFFFVVEFPLIPSYIAYSNSVYRALLFNRQVTFLCYPVEWCMCTFTVCQSGVFIVILRSNLCRRVLDSNSDGQHPRHRSGLEEEGAVVGEWVSHIQDQTCVANRQIEFLLIPVNFFVKISVIPEFSCSVLCICVRCSSESLLLAPSLSLSCSISSFQTIITNTEACDFHRKHQEKENAL